MKFFVIILAILNIVFSFLLLKKQKGHVVMCLDNIVIIAFITIFAIVFPFDYIYSVSHNSESKYLMVLSGFQLEEIFIYYVLEYIFLFIFVSTYRKFARGHNSSNFCQDDVDNKPQIPTKSFICAVYSLFLGGVISDQLYLKAYGGYTNYLKYSALIRSGIFVVENPFSFLAPIRGFVVLSSLLFLALSHQKNIIHKLFLIISTLYSLFVLYANRGRLSMILYFLVILLYFLFKKNTTKYVRLSTIFVTLAVGALFLYLIQVVGNLLDRNSSSDIIETFVIESAFPFANMKLLLSNRLEYRMFGDVFFYPVFLLPSSIWRKFFPDTASDILTVFLNGSKKGENGIYGEAPADILSFSYMQLNIFGIIVVAILSGIVIALIFNSLNKIRNKEVRRMFAIYLTVELVLRSVFYGDSYNIVVRMVPLIVLVLLYKFYSFIRNTIQLKTLKRQV